MEYENQNAIKKEYKTLKEAFRALPEDIMQHSIRVAEYTRVMFTEAIAIEMRVGTDEVEKLQSEFMRGAYLCGLYHDIGKVWLPAEYHHPAPEFGEEELALYRKHVAYGVEIAKQIPFGEPLLETELAMIKNALNWHHLRPDGLGFPAGKKKEEDIPLMALIVGMANHIDHLISTRRSETPFEDIMQQLLTEFPEDSELKYLVEESYSKLQRVFLKFREQSAIIPSIQPFVKRRANRPFELTYRPVMERKSKAVAGVQAKPAFKDNKDIYFTYDEAKTVINKNKLHGDIGRYFLYEAADTLRRMKICGLSIGYIAVQLMPKCYLDSKIVSAMQQVHIDARLEPGMLYFSLDEDMFENPPKALMANLERITKAEIPMMFNNWSGEYIKAKEIEEYSFKKVTLHPSLYERLCDKDVVADIKRLQKAGIEVIAGELDKVKYRNVLNELDIMTMTGALAGDYVSEDEIVKGELALKNVDTSAHI